MRPNEDNYKVRYERLLGQRDDLRAENDRLRAVVEACRDEDACACSFRDGVCISQCDYHSDKERGLSAELEAAKEELHTAVFMRGIAEAGMDAAKDAVVESDALRAQLAAANERAEKAERAVAEVSRVMCGNDNFPGDLAQYVRQEVQGRDTAEAERDTLAARVGELQQSAMADREKAAALDSIAEVLTAHGHPNCANGDSLEHILSDLEDRISLFHAPYLAFEIHAAADTLEPIVNTDCFRIGGVEPTNATVDSLIEDMIGGIADFVREKCRLWGFCFGAIPIAYDKAMEYEYLDLSKAWIDMPDDSELATALAPGHTDPPPTEETRHE